MLLYVFLLHSSWSCFLFLTFLATLCCRYSLKFCSFFQAFVYLYASLFGVVTDVAAGACDDGEKISVEKGGTWWRSLVK